MSCVFVRPCVEGAEFGALRRGFTAGPPPPEAFARVASEVRPDEQASVPGCSGSSNEVEEIRREFEAAKRSFLNNPSALKDIPLMNPRGLLFASSSMFGIWVSSH